MRKRTRLKITIIAGILMIGLALLSIHKETENIGMAAIAGVMTILASYIWGETQRPSNKESND